MSMLSRILVITCKLPLTWASSIDTNTKLASTAKLVCTLNNITTSKLHNFVADINCTTLHFHSNCNGTNWGHVSKNAFPPPLTHPLDPLPDLTHKFAKKLFMTTPSTFTSTGEGSAPLMVEFEV
jgi:hypothetical protein